MPYRKERYKKKQLSPEEIAYLSDDETADDGYTLLCYRHGNAGFDDDRHPRELWKEYRDEFLPAYIAKNPGRRPLPFWQWDAPRQPDQGSGCWYEGTLPEPRQRIGGTGTPGHEVLSLAPNFYKGIPYRWVSKFEEDYYNGRSVDIHGKPIGTEYKEGHFKGKAIDPNDPPTFESEAAYLDRHGLLTAAEKRHIEKHPESMNPEAIEVD